MESMESPLEVLSRAATMMQHCHNYPASDSDSFESPSTASGGESDRTVSPEAPRPLGDATPATASAPVTSKLLPTTKWRRERRSHRLPDYKPREGSSKAQRSQSLRERAAAPAVGRGSRSDGESPDEEERSPINKTRGVLLPRGAPPEYPGEAPIDMRLKSRPAQPPPPYPAAAAAPAAPRASVITHSVQDTPTGSMSMCDPVIDEHFRRSLGDDYMALFGKKAQPDASKKVTKDRGSSPIMFPSDPCANFIGNDKKKEELETQTGIEKQKFENKQNGAKQSVVEKQDGAQSKKDLVICEDVEMELDSASSSVDDHFAKALGDTWKKIQISRTLVQQQKEEGDKLTRRGVVI